MKPIFVETHWSEAGGELDTHKVWTFADFEAKALATATAYKQGGYLKTDVTVLFDDGSRIQMRLDLAETDIHGVRHHVEGYRRYLDTDRGRGFYAQSDAAGKAFFDSLLAIEFDEDPRAAA